MTDGIAKQIRRVILDQSMRAHVGHIGSALSIADIIAALYGGLLRVRDPKDPKRDRFVLGKGHRQILIPTREASRPRISAVPSDTAAKLAVRQKAQQLREDGSTLV